MQLLVVRLVKTFVFSTATLDMALIILKIVQSNSVCNFFIYGTKFLFP